MPVLAAFAVAALALLASPVRSEPDYPAFTGLVVDAAHVLSPADTAAMTRKLEDLQKKTGTQFAVATVPSLGGDEIEPYANALFRKWGIGTKGVSNGLLLILAPNERKLRFEVGYGLEGTMTDVQSKLILHNAMVPKLKAGDPAEALKAGVDDAIEVLTADKSLSQTTPANGDDSGALVIGLAVFGIVLLFILIVLVIVVRAIRRGGGTWTWGTGAGAGAFTSSRDSGISSSGGDSFSGGGGGDSGGGGASDSY